MTCVIKILTQFPFQLWINREYTKAINSNEKTHLNYFFLNLFFPIFILVFFFQHFFFLIQDTRNISSCIFNLPVQKYHLFMDMYNPYGITTGMKMSLKMNISSVRGIGQIIPSYLFFAWKEGDPQGTTGGALL